MIREELLERFSRYVKVNTKSDERSETTPSTACQLDLARILKDECEKMGLTEVTLDDNGYVMATLPSNIKEEAPVIGFIAHMDTSPDFKGEGVNPQIVEYNGGNIYLNKDINIYLSESSYPVLKNLIGETIITTDGTTLLGADDKNGIAEIMTAMSYLIKHPEISHGKIRIAFTPDEEVGRGADFFDVEKFGADFAYTIDGGALGELECENFNASSAIVKVNGSNIHPGYAKDKMKNSILIAYEFHNELPQNESPQHTSGYEGFYHLNDIEGSVESTTLTYILRDFETEGINNRKNKLKSIEEKLNSKYGDGTVEVILKDQYKNMKEVIDKYPEVMERAQKAMEALDIVPELVPIRGGTDGSRLSFMGLPCPNIFTGGYNFHGKYEFTVISYMELACKTIIEICKC
ncbi:MAG: peptidase T [Clostridium paraputrificum]|uniref:peptidase T n=1 Tax=Clostridium TaxID=1485 RepID=UPI000C08AA66|nr:MULTISPECIES: peptidase T [Clostridium]MDB2099228.1 peptidase T [Clostridium paraputrificum]MDU2107159.1 peptidase T [Clostridium sp.]MDU3354810.1 peptidase T [Clostridium sp.]MDU4725607.1 peptidase T [Clostridium sp.]